MIIIYIFFMQQIVFNFQEYIFINNRIKNIECRIYRELFCYPVFSNLSPWFIVLHQLLLYDTIVSYALGVHAVYIYIFF